jgi:hypothetical protein
MKKTVFIHIGPHKTGTTTIQHGLAINEKILRRRGVLSPKSGRPYPNNGGTHNLSWELRIPNSRVYNPKHGTWKDLLNEINQEKRVNKVILSSEDFCLLDTISIQAIREYLKDYEVKVIIYLRRQDEAHQSLWVEFVKNRANLPTVGSFYEWLEEYQYSIRNYDYAAILSKWEPVFSPDNILPRVFDPNAFQPSLFHDFLDLCQIKSNNITTPPHTNISPGAKTIEAIRLLKNHINIDQLDEPTWNFMAKGLTGLGSEKGWNDDKVNYLDAALSEKIMDHHGDANRAIAQKYFNREDLFEGVSVSQKPTTDFTYDDFSKDEAVEILAFIIDQLKKTPLQ